LIFEHGVENGHELAHTSVDGHLLGLADRALATGLFEPAEVVARVVALRHMPVPRFFGLLRSSYAQIGDLDRRGAASILDRLEESGEMRARVKSVHAPEEKDNPHVSLFID
jgi:hypothetical protein